MKNDNSRAFIFSRRLRNLLDSNQMDQKQLAEKLNISEMTVSRWINVPQLPKSDDLANIAELFGVSTDYLIGKDYILSEEEELEIMTSILKKYGHLNENDELTLNKYKKLMSFISNNKDFFE